MPAGDARLGLQPLGGRELACHALGLFGLLLAADVHEQPRPVTCHDHALAQALACLVVEVEGTQAIAEGQAVALVLQMNLHSPLVAHGASLSRRTRRAISAPLASTR